MCWNWLGEGPLMGRILALLAIWCGLAACRNSASPSSPVEALHPPSQIIEEIVWHPETHFSAAVGSDLWPTTWAADGNVYTAWGDGGGFEGSNSTGRVSLGFARIEGGPTDLRATNVNGGADSENLPTWDCASCGKTAGIISVDGVIYAWVNLQNRRFPNVDLTLAWSEDLAATWERATWVFPAGSGRFKPATFLNVDRDHRGGGAFVYFYGFRDGENGTAYLGRAPRGSLRDRQTYEFFTGLTESEPAWSADVEKSRPVFVDPNGQNGGHVVYNPGIGRYIMIGSRGPGGAVGVFEAPEPWGPWKTVALYDNWLDAGGGVGLVYGFVTKWTSLDGLTMWLVFSSNNGARKYDDRFNLVKATLRLRSVTADLSAEDSRPLPAEQETN